MLQKQTIEEQYLTGSIADEEIIQHFQETRRDAMKSEGAVYTPSWIVHAMLDRADIHSKSQRIVEPSSGHGSFVLPLIRFAKEKFDMTWDETAHWFISNVSCYDIDPDATAQLRSIVAMLFAREGVADVSIEDLINIETRDGLAVDPRGFDIAIGNPPYIRTQHLDAEYRNWIRETFDIAKSGNVDIYYAFLDHYISAVARCVFIVPNGCIKATGARALRERVFPFLTEIVDFRSKLVFPNARAYTCILTSSLDHKGPVAVRHDVDAPSTLVEWKSITGSEIHQAPRIAKSGVATLADGVFTVHRNAATGMYEGSVEGQPFEVEADLVRPFYKITKLASLSNINEPDRFILLPYASLSGNDVLSETELSGRYPKAFAYLTAYKEKLLARDKGKTEKYPAWYAFGRTQGLHDLSNREVVFIPTMIGGKSLPYLVDTTKVTEAYGSPLFVSGFAVTASSAARSLLTSTLFLEYVRENGAPKPGASELYYAISSKHVNAFLARELPAEELVDDE